MKLRIRAGLMMLLALAALRMGVGAYKSITPYTLAELPKDIYSKFSSGSSAAYCLKSCDGYVAVYENGNLRTPLSVTVIETAFLRAADRAMLDAGIPVDSDKRLLELLEDLGS